VYILEHFYSFFFSFFRKRDVGNVGGIVWLENESGMLTEDFVVVIR